MPSRLRGKAAARNFADAAKGVARSVDHQQVWLGHGLEIPKP